MELTINDMVFIGGMSATMFVVLYKFLNVEDIL